MDKMKRKKRKQKSNIYLLVLLAVLLAGGVGKGTSIKFADNGYEASHSAAKLPDNTNVDDVVNVDVGNVDISGNLDPGDIPEYSGNAYITINNNIPQFDDEQKKSKEEFEYYSDLDNLGRCGTAYANICPNLQPTEKRGEIGQVKPSGWHTVKYNDIIDGNYLYNRCHLIGYQLAGENANEKNLITGTRYLNVVGMLEFENKVDKYVDDTGNHVLYRVTPVFEGDDLVASGVHMEAWSVEDDGDGICFNVYCYNVQPGIGIDYLTGDSWEIKK